MRASEKAYATLRDEILAGDLEAGTQLAEVEQAQRLGVSRTPVREALSRLRADGLITAQSPRVLVVTALDAGRVRNIYELREALEMCAASLAARKRDADVFVRILDRILTAPKLLDATDTQAPEQAGLIDYFAAIDELDEQIERAADNPYLAAALASSRLHSRRVRRLARHDTERLRQAAQEHATVVRAILDGDGELAANATRVHLRNSLRSALRRIEQSE